jgi:hypothetical protein
MISFVTCVKICTGYEDYVHRLEVYVENIASFMKLPYEIIIVEEKAETFSVDIKGPFVRVVQYVPNYPNPHGYSMIEAYAKNVGIKEAKYSYICVTNADVFFDADFFESLRHLRQNTFYRFHQYEVPVPLEWSWACVQKSMEGARWINPKITSGSIQGVAHKAGDVMLMHRDGWERIKGYPENEVWVHSDLVVCVVVSNNGIRLDVPKGGVYTYEQSRSFIEQPHEMQTALLYSDKKTTND